ncbi:DUF1857-domain-containing protein [Aulographum hederae CBS 113979]|uniref:DUF1857-domain-containing protein n=1 Tax=Aulographum hederae CBS 113979 TaxID=1176131 RepID=A0A6G1H3U9_9PEZI|nr:DUF1857-domain-containing protein [Aulographum hederae CBS 113979]
MVKIHLAYTAPINPPSASPLLTEAQIWQGLVRKVRRAYEYVPIITRCDVVSEKEGEITRVVNFKEGTGPPGDVREVCKLMEPCRIDFLQTDGSTISNIVSDGPSGETSDLMMTYSFEWVHPNIEAGSEEEKAKMIQYKKMARGAVEGSIDTIRRFVKEGEIA